MKFVYLLTFLVIAFLSVSRGEPSDEVATVEEREKQYCIAKFVIEREMLDFNGVNLNPDNIPTEDIDCETIIKNRKTKDEKFIEDYFVKDNLKENQRTCIRQVFEETNYYDWLLAKYAFAKVETGRTRAAQNHYTIEDKSKFMEQKMVTCKNL